MLLEQGYVIDDFLIEAPLAGGGSGTVYTAYQRSLNRKVALKVVELHSESQDHNKRFMREVEMMVRLEHIHIVPIYGYGILDDETGYFAMRLLQNGTVADLLRKSEFLPLESAVWLAQQIASGLDFMHSMGATHRDIKPSNILLDDTGNAYLSDFGLSHLHDMTQSHASNGLRVNGTPAYIAPELLQGEKASVLSDVYSLGIMLYQMLTGRVPFESAHGGVAALFYQHLRETPPSPRLFNAALSPKVEKVLLHALNKKPQARYSSAGAFADALHHAAMEPFEGTKPSCLQGLRQLVFRSNPPATTSPGR